MRYQTIPLHFYTVAMLAFHENTRTYETDKNILLDEFVPEYYDYMNIMTKFSAVIVLYCAVMKRR